jgi:hypothetical protein
MLLFVGLSLCRVGRLGGGRDWSLEGFFDVGGLGDLVLRGLVFFLVFMAMAYSRDTSSVT